MPGCIRQTAGREVIAVDANSSGDSKRGYLIGDFAFFHLSDMKNTQFEYHYHDFNKIIVFISGNVTYLIEGNAYRLKPWDILFVSSSELHKPVIDPCVMYERIVIWVNPGFLSNHSRDWDLFTCFSLTNGKNNLLRLDGKILEYARTLCTKLEEACKSKEFGSSLLKNSIFLQLIVVLTRELLKGSRNDDIEDIIHDKYIRNILDFINENLKDELTIDSLAARFYMSRYHMMHKFKQLTGYPVHSYILQKRLIKADTLIKSGIPSMQACEQCGFNDYSNFVRSYKKLFGVSPRNRLK